MTANLIIRETVYDDIKIILDDLRKEDYNEIVNAGVKPEDALYGTFASAFWSKTAVIDGKPSAFWGVAGSVLGKGVPFLLTANDVTKISPLTFFRVYKKEISDITRFFPYLENYVDSEYTGATRMLEMAGFSLDEPQKIKQGTYQRFYMNV